MISPAEPAGRADVPTEPPPVDSAQIEPAQMLAAYDAQLRTQSEAAHALSVARQGPLWLITFRGGSGFVTYQDLAGATPVEIARMVSESLDHFRADPEVIEVEWKTRGHDRAPGLQTALLANGFVAEEAESIMLGPELGRRDQPPGFGPPSADHRSRRCVADERDAGRSVRQLPGTGGQQSPDRPARRR